MAVHEIDTVLFQLQTHIYKPAVLQFGKFFAAVDVGNRTVLRDAGADFFAVATIGEGVELREAGFTLPILVLGYVGDADAALLAEYDIAAALCDTDTAKAFSAAAEQYAMMTGPTTQFNRKRGVLR